MPAQQNIIKLIKAYVDFCNTKNIHFNKVILFGSYAKDTAGKDSDIDVLLVSDQFTDNTFDNWRSLAPVTAKFYNIEPHPYPTSYFLKGDPFITEIKKYGIEIKI
ncbi:MAG: nucleotidyltransferase domain-containing protein [Bacteroidales bacterium]